MRRITECLMFKSEAEAQARAADHLKRWPYPYEPDAFVMRDGSLPAPFTHTATVARWNSCD